MRGRNAVCGLYDYGYDNSVQNKKKKQLIIIMKFDRLDRLTSYCLYIRYRK